MGSGGRKTFDAWSDTALLIAFHKEIARKQANNHSALGMVSTMQVYFSHSYRDVAINSHFIERLAHEDIPIRADQKTDVWCVAKLERYLAESTGFISIITRRPTDQDIGGYSPYIGRELNLARRARVPRLLFVDEDILKLHRLDFPEDVVPFQPGTLGEYTAHHDDVIRHFRVAVEIAARANREVSRDEAIVVSSGAGTLLDAARDAAEILRRQKFNVSLLVGKFEDRGLDDIRLLESLWRAELCVFLLGERMADAHIALALAHAHSIPSIRLQYDRRVEESTVMLSGTIRWRDHGDMLVQMERQVTSYRNGLVQPVEMAQASSATDAARAISTMRWRARNDNYWDKLDGTGLLNHVRPEQNFVQDEANRVRRAYGSSLSQARSRENSMQICRLAYEGIRRHRFGYEFEPASSRDNMQVIRTPAQVETHRTANCLDLACLFAGLIEASNQAPIIVVIDGPGYAHALVGVRSPGEPSWQNPEHGDLRRAIALGDAVFFEPTGAVEVDVPVAAETEAERRDKLLDFMSAKAAAERMIERKDIRLRHVIDVQARRQSKH
jgi:hypothetical protein